MTLPALTERVVIRLLENARMIYRDLPIERPGEASEFCAVLDLAVGMIKARAAHRAAADALSNLKLVAGGTRRRKKESPISAGTLSGLSSAKPMEREIA